MRGRGNPVIGIIPIVIPTLIKIWEPIIVVNPTAKRAPKLSFARRAIAIPRARRVK